MSLDPTADDILVAENTTSVVDLDCGDSDVPDLGTDLCDLKDAGKPVALTLTYAFGTSFSQATAQDDGKRSIQTVDPDTDGEVFIRVLSKSGDVLFAGTVLEGESFAVDNGGDKFGSETHVEIYDSEGGDLLQSVEFHTSCSQPLAIGDVFGSIALNGATLQNGMTVGLDAGAADGDAGVTYTIFGGADAALFEVDPNTGEVSFIDAPDFENPQDAGGDNRYEVVVLATRADGSEELKPLSVCVEDDCITVSENTTAVIDLDCGRDEIADIGTDLCDVAGDGDDDDDKDDDDDDDKDDDDDDDKDDDDDDDKDDDDDDDKDDDDDDDCDDDGSDGGKALELTLTYAFGTSFAQAADQDDASRTIETLGLDADGEVFIRVRNDSGNELFAGTVIEGQSFTVDNGGETFGSDTVVEIFDSEFGALLQTIEFDTSGAQPLAIGDVFGSVAVNGATLVGGATLGLNRAPGVGDFGVTYAIDGGADAALFQVDPDTGEVSFIDAPDFEDPQDADGDNQYDVVISATYDDGTVELKPLDVCVEDECITVSENTTAVIDLDCGREEIPDIGTDLCDVAGDGDDDDDDDKDDDDDDDKDDDDDDDKDDDDDDDKDDDDDDDKDDDDDDDKDDDDDDDKDDDNDDDCDEDGSSDSDGGKALELTLTYAFGTSFAQAADQDDASRTIETLGLDTDGEVFIRVRNDSGNELFAGTVIEGQSFAVDNGGETFGSDTVVEIFDSEFGALLQTIEFDTSGAQPLAIGDVFGSIAVNGATLVGGATLGLNRAPGTGDFGVTYAIDGGADAALFQVDPDTGEVSFIDAPDFEDPQDADGDNQYDVVISATYDDGTVELKPLEVCVEDECITVRENTTAVIDLDCGRDEIPDVGTNLCDVVGDGDDDDDKDDDDDDDKDDDDDDDKDDDDDDDKDDDDDDDKDDDDDDDKDDDDDDDKDDDDDDDKDDDDDDDKDDDDDDDKDDDDDGDDDGDDDDEPDAPDDCKAVELTLTYAFGTSIAQASDQDDDERALETLDENFVGESVFIRVLDGDGNALFAGTVLEGQSFSVDNGGEAFGDDTHVEIYESENGALLQTIEFDTSGLQPLAIGDVFGSITVNGAVLENGATLGLNSPATGAGDLGVTYEIDGGADAALFQVDPETGVVSFINAPDFENPGDVNGDNIYEVVVRAVRDDGTFELKPLEVCVEDEPDGDPQPGSLSGRYFCDTNNNDIDDGNGNEPGVGGVRVMLLDSLGNPALDIGGNPVATVDTAADGSYAFVNLAAGSYTVKFTDPNGVLADKRLVDPNDPNGNGDETNDSDAIGDTTESTIENIVVVAGQDTPDNDAGAELPGSLSGRFFCDTNNNDIDDNNGDEPGVGGVVVMLLDSLGNPALDIDGIAVPSVETEADGSYAFANLAPGSYTVKFTDPNGVLADKRLVDPNDPNGNGDETNDSDAIGDTTESTIENIVVVAGQDTPDNDAGAELPGSLSGRFFCDTNNNDVDDNNGDEPGVGGVVVMLLDSLGNPALDIDGNPVATVDTAADGSYAFGNLAPGSYTVKFTDPNGVLAGKNLVADNDPNDNGLGDDSDDSDAIGNTTESTIPAINVVAGQNTPDNDAGVRSLPPLTDLDSAKTCYDEPVSVDVTGNDSDPEGGPLTITAVNGQPIVDGGLPLNIGGVLITLQAGQLVFDGSVAHADLLTGEEALESFTYTVTDVTGLSTDETVEVTFCGTTDTLDKIADSLPAYDGVPDGILQVVDESFADIRDAYTIELSNTNDPRLDGIYDEAYCLSIFAELNAGEGGITGNAPEIDVQFELADTDLQSTSLDGSVGENGESAEDNMDLINWMLNQDFGNQDNGDGNGDTYTDAEIQSAIWALTDGALLESFGFDRGVVMADGAGFAANAIEILDEALLNGEGFEAADGQLVGVLVDPAGDNAGEQPFIVGIDLFDDCLC